MFNLAQEPGIVVGLNVATAPLHDPAGRAMGSSQGSLKTPIYDFQQILDADTRIENLDHLFDA
jgi:hypothetical protein